MLVINAYVTLSAKKHFLLWMKIKPEYFEKYGKETPAIFISSFLFDRNNFLHHRPNSTRLWILWGEEQRRVLREEQSEFLLLWVHADHHSRRHWHRRTAGSVTVCPCYIMLNCLSVSLYTLHNVILCQCQSVHATLCHTVSVYLRYIMSYCVSVSLSTLHNMLSYCLSVSLSMLHYVILSQCQSVHATSCNTASVFVFPHYIICCHTVSVSVYPWYTCILYCHTVSVCPRYIISRHTV